MRIVVYRSRSLLQRRQPWRFRILAANGEIVAQSEGYSRGIDCWDTAMRIGVTPMSVEEEGQEFSEPGLD